jgi:hypothetical protein
MFLILYSKTHQKATDKYLKGKPRCKLLKL